MRTSTRVPAVIAASAIATALLASSGFAVGRGGPSSADPGTPSPQSTQVATCDGTGPGSGTGTPTGNRSGRGGHGVAGQGRGTGTGMGTGAGTRADLTDVASGTLTDAQRLDLAAIAEDEKLAHDLYVAFADAYSTTVFTRIASAETQHLTEVRVVLDRYDIADPTLGLPVGTFATVSFQELYDTQLAAGSVDLAAAFEAGVVVETTDIASLKEAATGLAAPDVEQVYAHLLSGSERHLSAFAR